MSALSKPWLTVWRCQWDKVLVNIEHYGNTSAATLPLCIWDYEDKLKKGDNIIFTAFGAGFTWGAVYVKWGYDGKKES